MTTDTALRPALAGRSRPAPPTHTLSRSLDQLGLMVQWQLRRSSAYLPLMIVVQILLAVATVVGYGLLAGDVGHTAGLYLATGAPTITLITIGLVMTPQSVLQSKTEGSLDWLRTLPVPREVFLLADLCIWTVIALPGAVIGALAGTLAFGVSLAPTWWLIPATLLVSLTSASLGYAIGTLLHPTLAHLLSQVLLFVVMLFTPISYPVERLPDWAQAVHQWLPLEPMAQAIRGSLASNEFSVEPRAWAVLTAWCVVAVVCAGVALRKRD